MFWGAAAHDKNGCERTRNRDRDSQAIMQHRDDRSVLSPRGAKALGDPPPDPLGFSALVPIPKGEKTGRHLVPPLRSWPLGRRSGRFPPLPYPPPRSKGIVPWQPSVGLKNVGEAHRACGPAKPVEKI